MIGIRDALVAWLSSRAAPFFLLNQRRLLSVENLCMAAQCTPSVVSIRGAGAIEPHASPLLEPGSASVSSASCSLSPKLLDTLPDAPNTPITPFTNRDSGHTTDTSPLNLYVETKEHYAIGDRSSDASLVQMHEAVVSSDPLGSAGSTESRGRPAACLFVASLSSSRTDEQLCTSVTNHFRKWGNLLNVKVLKDWMQRPYSFVQFEHFEDARRALREAHNTVIDGRHIRVEKARVNRTLYISRVGQPLEEQDVRCLLEPYGEIEDIVIPSGSNPMLRNNMGKCCFARFAFRDDAIQAFSNLRRNENWIVEWAQNLDQNSSQIPAMPIDKTSVFVGQLNPALVTRESLLNRFKKYGEIVECTLVNKPYSNRMAFAFLQFGTAASASAAVENENNSNFLDRVIRVQFRELHDKVDLSMYESRPLPSMNPQNQFGCKYPFSLPFMPRLRSRSNDSLSFSNRGSVYGQDNANIQGCYQGITNQAFSMRSQEAFVAAYRAALAATTSLSPPLAINPQNGYSGNIQVPYPNAPIELKNHMNSNASASGYNNQHTVMNIHQSPNIIPAPFYYFPGGMNVHQNMASNSSLNQGSLSPQQDHAKGNNVSVPFVSHWGTLIPAFIHGPGPSSVQASMSLPGPSLTQHQDSLNRLYHFPEGVANGSIHPMWDLSYGYYRFDNQCSPEIPSLPVQVPAMQDNPGVNCPVYREVSGHSSDQNIHPPYPLDQPTVNGGITT